MWHVNEHLRTSEWERVAFGKRMNELQMVMNIYSMQVKCQKSNCVKHLVRSSVKSLFILRNKKGCNFTIGRLGLKSKENKPYLWIIRSETPTTIPVTRAGGPTWRRLGEKVSLPKTNIPPQTQQTHMQPDLEWCPVKGHFPLDLNDG